jgi:hypothetical protein
VLYIRFRARNTNLGNKKIRSARVDGTQVVKPGRGIGLADPTALGHERANEVDDTAGETVRIEASAEHRQQLATYELEPRAVQALGQRARQALVGGVSAPGVEDAGLSNAIVGVQHKRVVIGVDQQGAPARPQHAMDLGQRPVDIGDILQDLDRDGGIERGVVGW